MSDKTSPRPQAPQPRERRFFSEEFKRQKVKELCSRQITVIQICRLYEVSATSVYKWLRRFSPHHSQPATTLVVQMETEAQKTMMLLARVAELERIIGQKQLEIDFINKLLEIGSAELGFDLKKNFSTQLSNGSGSASPRQAPPAKPTL